MVAGEDHGGGGGGSPGRPSVGTNGAEEEEMQQAKGRECGSNLALV